MPLCPCFISSSLVPSAPATLVSFLSLCIVLTFTSVCVSFPQDSEFPLPSFTSLHTWFLLLKTSCPSFIFPVHTHVLPLPLTSCSVFPHGMYQPLAHYNCTYLFFSNISFPIFHNWNVKHLRQRVFHVLFTNEFPAVVPDTLSYDMLNEWWYSWKIEKFSPRHSNQSALCQFLLWNT